MSLKQPIVQTFPRESLIKSRVLSASHGLCGEALSAGKVGHLGKESNKGHKTLEIRQSVVDVLPRELPSLNRLDNRHLV